MRKIKLGATTIAAWMLVFSAIGWMALDTFAAGSKSSGATVVEDDLTTGSAGSVGLTGGSYEVSGSLGQVATEVSQNGAVEAAAGYFAYPAGGGVPTGVTKTWAGTNGGLASLGSNWVGGIAPVDGDYVVFGSNNPNNSCNWDLAISLSSITFNGSYAASVNFNRQIAVDGPFEVLTTGATAFFTPGASNRHVLSGPITVASGAFIVNGTTMVAVGSMTVNYGLLQVGTTALFQAGDVALGANGWLQLWDQAWAGPPVLTSTDSSSYLNIKADGVVMVSSGVFQRLSPQGIRMGNTAVVASFSTVTFQGPSPAGSTAINFYQASTIVLSTFTNVNFADSNISVNVNAANLIFPSRITMRASLGSRGGMPYENDPGSRVDWPDIASLSAGAYTAVSTDSVTANWNSPFGLGTPYYARLSTGAFPNGFSGNLSSDTYHTWAKFSGLASNTTYYGRMSTDSVTGPWVDLGPVSTLIEAPVAIYFDEISSAAVTASALPSLRYMNLGRGLSGIDWAKNGTYGAWQGVDSWTPKSILSPARYSATAVALDGKVYVMGGNVAGDVATVEAYDSAMNSWSTLASLPGGRYAGEAAVIDGKIYYAGGWTTVSGLPQSDLFVYDPATNVWNTLAGLPSRPPNGSNRSACGVGGAINGKFYVTTGCDGFGGYRKIFDVYDPATNVWTTLASSNEEHQSPAGGVIDGKLYVAGGQNNAGAITSVVEVYDPAGGWTTKAPMLTPRYGMTSAVIGGQLYAIGGLTTTTGGGIVGTVEVYDPVADTWTARAPMTTARVSLFGAASGGRVYAIGGSDIGSLTVNEEYNPGSANKFTGLLPNTQYSFKAKARNQVGVETAESPTISTYTLAVASMPPAGVPLFQASFISSITVNWSSGSAAGGFNGPGATYLVQVSTMPTFVPVDGSNLTANLSETFTALDMYTTNYFRVLAYNSVGGTDGRWFNLGTMAPPLAVGNLTASAGAFPGSVKLTWTWPENVPAGSSFFIMSSNTTTGWDFKYVDVIQSTGPVNAGQTASINYGGLPNVFDPSNADGSSNYYFQMTVRSPVGMVSPVSNQTAGFKPAAPPAQTVSFTNLGAPGTPGGGWLDTVNDGSNGADRGFAVAKDPVSGDYLAAGTYFNGSNKDIMVRFFDSAGANQGAWVYNGPDNLDDMASGITAANGCAYVVGKSSASGHGNILVLFKVNLNSGIIEAKSDYHNPEELDSSGQAVSLDGSGGVYVAGTEVRAGQGNNILALKYDASDLQLLWTTSYVTAGVDIARGIAAGGAYVYVAGEANGDAWLGKYDAASALLSWTTTYNGPGGANDSANAVVNDGAYLYVAGNESTPSQGLNAFVRKYDFGAVLMWHRSYNGSGAGDDRGNAVAVNPTSVFVAGNTVLPGTASDILVMKLNAGSGLIDWTTAYAGPYFGGNDEGQGIFAEAGGDAVAAGWEYKSVGQAENLWVRAYNYDAFQGAGAGTTKIWQGTASGKASAGSNWMGGFAPVDGDYVVFGATNPANGCDWDLGIGLSSVTFAVGYSSQVAISSQIVVNGPFELLAPNATAYFKTNGANKHVLNGPVTVSTGAFKVNGTTVVAVGTVTVNNGGVFYLTDGALFQGTTVTVNQNGRIRVFDIGVGAPVLTSTSAATSLSLVLYGDVDISSGVFQRLSKSGIEIGLGASIVNLSSFTFQGPLQPGTTAINLNAAAGVFTSTFTNVTFADPNIAVNVNASVLNTASRITMREYKGTQAGPAFENDPTNLVEWPTLTGGVAAPFNLAAVPGPFVGSVGLQWQWGEDLGGGGWLYVQYSTYAGANWDISKAQVKLSTGPTNQAPGGGNLVVGGLDTGRDGADADISPWYYFRVWGEKSGGALSPSSNQSSAKATLPSLETTNFTSFGASGPGSGWRSSVNGPSSTEDEGRAVAKDGSGNVYVTGLFDGPAGKLFVRKYSPAGSVVWTKYYNSGANAASEGSGIAVSGAFLYVAGFEDRTDLSQGDNMILRKYDTDGLFLGATEYNGVANQADEAGAVTVDGSGNVYVAGFETVAGQNRNGVVRKYAPSLQAAWTTTYNGVAGNNDEALAVAADGGYVYAAGYQSVVGQSSNVWVRKYDASNAVVQWTRTYDGPTSQADAAYGVAADGSGVYVVGHSSQGAENDNIWVRKYDLNGNAVWTSTFNGVGNDTDRGKAVALDGGSIYVVGFSSGPNAADIWLGKYDAGGLAQWTTTYTSALSKKDHGYGVVVDVGNVYVAGYETKSGTQSDMWLRKYNADAFGGGAGGAAQEVVQSAPLSPAFLGTSSDTASMLWLKYWAEGGSVNASSVSVSLLGDAPASLVQVKAFKDLNANGVIDGGEPMYGPYPFAAGSPPKATIFANEAVTGATGYMILAVSYSSVPAGKQIEIGVESPGDILLVGPGTVLGTGFPHRSGRTNVQLNLYARPSNGAVNYSTPAATNIGGLDTGFYVSAGQMLNIDASGTWDIGAGATNADGNIACDGTCPVPAANGGRMIYRVGSSNWQAAGVSSTITVSGSGNLYLGANDSAGNYYDNSGFVSVAFKVLTSTVAKVWMGGSAGFLSKANLDSNWQGGKKPYDGESVVLDTSTYDCDWDIPGVKLNLLTMTTAYANILRIANSGGSPNTLTVSSNATISRGTLDLMGNTLEVQGTLLVRSSATLDLASGVLRVKDMTVGFGSFLREQANPAARIENLAGSAGWRFVIGGATVTVNNATSPLVLRNATVEITSRAVINAFSNVSFQGDVLNSTASLTIRRSSPESLSFNNWSFDAFVSTNVDASGVPAGSVITFNNASGSRFGSSREYDPQGVVSWAPDGGGVNRSISGVLSYAGSQGGTYQVLVTTVEAGIMGGAGQFVYVSSGAAGYTIANLATPNTWYVFGFKGTPAVLPDAASPRGGVGNPGSWRSDPLFLSDSNLTGKNITIEDWGRVEGNIVMNTSQAGTIRVQAWRGVDPPCAGCTMENATTGPPGGAYVINVPPASDYSIIAFVDVDNDGQIDSFEAVGSSATLDVPSSPAHSGTNITISGGGSVAGGTVYLSTHQAHAGYVGQSGTYALARVKLYSHGADSTLNGVRLEYVGDLPTGSFELSVYDDANGNGTLETVGAPPFDMMKGNLMIGVGAPSSGTVQFWQPDTIAAGSTRTYFLNVGLYGGAGAVSVSTAGIRVSSSSAFALGAGAMASQSGLYPVTSTAPARLAVPGYTYAYANNAGGLSTQFWAYAGQTLALDAVGEWRNFPSGGLAGPDGFPATSGNNTVYPPANVGALIGRIEGPDPAVSNPWFKVGASTTVTLASSGQLILAMNDYVGGFGDNTGELFVAFDVSGSTLGSLGGMVYYGGVGSASGDMDVMAYKDGVKVASMTVAVSPPTPASYQFDGLAPGDYSVKAQHLTQAGHKADTVQTVTVQAGQAAAMDVYVSLGVGSISGNLFYAGSQGFGDFLVVATTFTNIGNDSVFLGSAAIISTWTASATTTYFLTDLPMPNTYYLVAIRDGNFNKRLDGPEAFGYFDGGANISSSPISRMSQSLSPVWVGPGAASAAGKTIRLNDKGAINGFVTLSSAGATGRIFVFAGRGQPGSPSYFVENMDGIDVVPPVPMGGIYYDIDMLRPGSDYSMWAFLDSNANGTWDGSEPFFQSASSGTVISSSAYTSQSFALTAPMAPPEVPGFRGTMQDDAVFWYWDLVQGATQYDLRNIGGTSLHTLYPPTTFYADTGLGFNAMSGIRSITASNPVGTGPSNLLLTFYSNPATPTGLSALNVYMSSATLGWGIDGNPAGTEYEVRRATGVTNPGMFLYVGSTTRVSAGETPVIFTDVGLAPGATYFWLVFARNQNGNYSPASNQAQNSALPAPTANPSIAGTVSYAGSQPGSIIVEAKTNQAFTGLPAAKVALPKVASQTYYLPLPSAGDYYVRGFVDARSTGSYRAGDDLGYYILPATSTKITVLASPATGYNFAIAVDTVPPAMPVGFTINAGVGQMALAWAAPTRNADNSTLLDLGGFMVERSSGTAGAPYASLTPVALSSAALAFTDFSPIPDALNSYRVRAIDLGLNVSSPTAPIALTASMGGSITGFMSTFTVTGAGVYRVRLSTVSRPNAPFVAERNLGGQGSFAFTGLSTGTYYLRAFRDVNNDFSMSLKDEPSGTFGGVNSPYPIYVFGGSAVSGSDIAVCDRTPILPDTPISGAGVKLSSANPVDCPAKDKGPGYYADLYAFSVGGGQAGSVGLGSQVSVQLDAPTYEEEVVVFDPYGGLVGRNSAAGGASLQLTAVTTGVYLIESTSFGPGQVGDYSVTMGLRSYSGAIGGSLTFGGSGVLRVQVFNSPDPRTFALRTADIGPGAYSYFFSGLADGTYYIRAFKDMPPGNGVRDANEPSGAFGPQDAPTAVTITGGVVAPAGPVSFVVSDPAIGAIDGSILYAGSQAGPIRIEVGTCDQPQDCDPYRNVTVTARTSTGAANAYLLGFLSPATSYVLRSYVDQNSNFMPDLMEAKASSSPVNVIANSTASVYLELVEPGSGASGDAVLQGTIAYSGSFSSTVYLGISRDSNFGTIDYMMSMEPTGSWPLSYMKSGLYGDTTYYVGAFMDLNGNVNPDETAGEPMGQGAPPGAAPSADAAPIYVPLSGVATGNVLLQEPPNGRIQGKISVSSAIFNSPVMAPLFVEAYIPGYFGQGGGQRMTIDRLPNTTYYMYSLGNLAASTGTMVVKAFIDPNLNRWVDMGEPVGQRTGIVVSSQTGGSPAPTTVNMHVIDPGAGNNYGVLHGTIAYTGSQGGSFVLRFFNNSTFSGAPVAIQVAPAPAGPVNRVWFKEGLPLGTYWVDAFRDATGTGVYDPAYQAHGSYGASAVLSVPQPSANLGVMNTMTDPGTGGAGAGTISGTLRYNGTAGGGFVRAVLRPRGSGVVAGAFSSAYAATTAFSFPNVSTGSAYMVQGFIDVNNDGVPASAEPVVVSSATGMWLMGPTLSGQSLVFCDRKAIATGVDVYEALTSTDCPSVDRGGAFQKLYAFTGTRGQPVTIEMKALNFYDAYLNLYDPNGNLVAFDDESAGLGNPRITGYNVVTDGIHTIGASAYSPNVTGSFKLSLMGSSGGLGSIAGNVIYNGTQGGQIVVGLFNSPAFSPATFVADRLLVSTRAFRFDNLTSGTSYYMGAFVDANFNHNPDQGEDAGVFGSAGAAHPIYLLEAQNLSGLDVTIQASTSASMGYITGIATYTYAANGQFSKNLIIELWPTANMTGQPSAVRQIPVTVYGPDMLANGINFLPYDVAVPGNANYYIRGFLDLNNDFLPSVDEPRGVYAPIQGAEPVFVPAGGTASNKDFKIRNAGISYRGEVAGQGTASLDLSSMTAGVPLTLHLRYTLAGAGIGAGGKVGFFVPPGWGMPWGVSRTWSVADAGALTVNGPAVSVVAANGGAHAAAETLDFTFNTMAPCVQGFSTFTVISSSGGNITPVPVVAGSPVVQITTGAPAYFQPRTPYFSVRANELSEELRLDAYDACGNKTQATAVSTATLRAKAYDVAVGQFVTDASFGFSSGTALATTTPLALYYDVGQSSRSFYVYSVSSGPKNIELFFNLAQATTFYYGFSALPGNALSNVKVATSPYAVGSSSVTLVPGDPTKPNMAYFNFTLGDQSLGWRVALSSTPFKTGAEPNVVWERYGYGQPGQGAISWDGRYSPWVNNGVRVPNGIYYVRIEVGSGVKDESLKVAVSAMQLAGTIYDIGKTPALPLSGAVLDFYGPFGGGKSWSDGVGGYAMSGLAAGTYQISLNKPDYLSGWAKVKVESNATVSSWTAVTDAVAVATNTTGGVDFYMKSPPFLTVSGWVDVSTTPYDRWGNLAIRKSTACVGGAVTGDTIWGPLRLKTGATTFDDGGQWDPGTQMFVERSYLKFQVAVATYTVEASFEGFAPACDVRYVDAAGASVEFSSSAFARKSSVEGNVTVPASANGMFVSVSAIPLSTTTRITPGFGGVWIDPSGAPTTAKYLVGNLDAGLYILKGNAPNLIAVSSGPIDVPVSSAVTNMTLPNFSSGKTLTGAATVNADTTGRGLKLYVNAWSPGSLNFGSTEVYKTGGASGLGINYAMTGLQADATYQVYAYLEGAEGLNLEPSETGTLAPLPLTLLAAQAVKNFTFEASSGVIAGTITITSNDFLNVDLYREIVASARQQEVGQTYQILSSTNLPGFLCTQNNQPANSGTGLCPAGNSSATFKVQGLPTQTMDVSFLYKTTGQNRKYRVSVVNGSTTTVAVDLTPLTYSITGEIANQISTSVFKSSSTGAAANILANAMWSDLLDAKGARVPISPAGVPVSTNTLARVLAIRQELASYGLAVSTSFNPATDRVGFMTAAGTYTIANVPPGSYLVRTENLRSCAVCPIVVPSVGQMASVRNVNKSSVNFTLSDGFAVGGKIYFDENIEDAAAFTLTVYNKRREVVRSTMVYLGDASLGVKSNYADYSFSNLPSGEFYALSVRDAGLPPKYAGKPIRFPDPTSTSGLQGDLAGQDVLMYRAAGIVGRIKDASTGELINRQNAGLLAPNFQIKAVANPFVEGGYMVAQASVAGRPVQYDGYFRVPELIPKLTYDLKLGQTAWDPAFLAQGSQNYAPVTVSGLLLQSGETRDVGVVGLTQGTYLTGVVRQSTTTGPTLGNIKVTAKPTFGTALEVQTFTNQNGAYTLWVSTTIMDVTAAPRDGNLASDGNRYGQRVMKSVNLLSQTTADFLLDPLPAGVTGQVVVVDSATGGTLSYPFGDKKGFPAAAINLQRFGTVPLKNPLGDIEVVTDSEGNFEAPGLSTGGYLMRVTSLGYAVYRATVSVVSTTTVVMYDAVTNLPVAGNLIVLQRGGSVSGRILKRDGSSPSEDEVGGIAAANFAAGEFVVGSVEFDPTAKTVSAYHLSGFKPGTVYDIVILPKDKAKELPVFPPEGKNFSVASETTVLTDYALTYPSTDLGCVATSRSPTAAQKALGNLQFQVRIECTKAMRKETGYDDDLGQILTGTGCTRSDGGALCGEFLNADKEMNGNRRNITAIYRATSTAELTFGVGLAVYPAERNYQTGDYDLYTASFTFYTGLDSNVEGHVSNIQGGAVSLEAQAAEEERSNLNLEAGTFADLADAVCASCTVRMGVSKGTDPDLAKAIAKRTLGYVPAGVGARLRPGSVPAEMEMAMQAYRTQASTGSYANPLSAYYSIFLPAWVKHQLKKRADLTLSFDMASTTDTSKVNVWFYCYDRGAPECQGKRMSPDGFVLEETNRNVDAMNKTITVSIDHLSTFVVRDGDPPQRATGQIVSEKIHAFAFPNPADCITHSGLTADTRAWGAGTTHGAFDGVKIRYTLPDSGRGRYQDAVVNIYNVAGELVRSIPQQHVEGGGTYYTTWACRNSQGKSVASGIYFAEVAWGSERKFFKIAIIKGSGL
ncbi:MAG: hypothetical protein HY927_05735 [Elusimicrobia bacterium]|nr:hypothetical protein [Elusimicrobiota bacterium]